MVIVFHSLVSSSDSEALSRIIYVGCQKIQVEQCPILLHSWIAHWFGPKSVPQQCLTLSKCTELKEICPIWWLVTQLEGRTDIVAKCVVGSRARARHSDAERQEGLIAAAMISPAAPVFCRQISDMENLNFQGFHFLKKMDLNLMKPWFGGCGPFTYDDDDDGWDGAGRQAELTYRASL